MISIVVPVYNAEKYLHRCVDSVLAQENPNWELLLVDDGSSDSSAKICEDYSKKDKRIRSFRQSNGGVSTARNLGIDNARGQWITFVDSDDYINSSFCSINENEENDIIIKSHLIVRNDYTTEKPKDFNFEINKDDIEQFLSENLNAQEFRVPWGKFFRTEIIKCVRFPIGQKIGEDTVFMLTVLTQTKKIVFNGDGIYYWQQGELSDSEKYRLTSEDCTRFATSLFESYERTNISCVRLEKFILLYFFDLMDKRRPWRVRRFFQAPIISKYYRKLNNEGQLPRPFKLWKKMPVVKYSLIRLKRIITNKRPVSH